MKKLDKNPFVGDNRRKEDMISHLPDSLLCEILVNVPTKDVVKTSLLCHRWRYLWQAVPALDLVINVSADSSSIYRFLNRFVELNIGLCLKRIKLSHVGLMHNTDYSSSETINTLVRQKIQHLDVGSEPSQGEVCIPPTVYTLCESLVSLKLCRAVLPKPAKSVSLPRLKMMNLQQIKFVDSLDIEILISGCPALETLSMDHMYADKVLSQSLMSLHLTRDDQDYKSLWSLYLTRDDQEDRKTQVVMETPRLKYLKLSGQYIKKIIINDMSSFVKLSLVGLNRFDDESIPSFFSSVKDLTISLPFKLFHFGAFSELEKLSQFYNLSILSIKGLRFASWKCLLVFLKNTPNLKSLFMEMERCDTYGTLFRDLPQCVLSSLEYVEVKSRRLADVKKLWRHFIENSRVLKKFTLYLDHNNKEEDRAILKELFTLPIRPNTCELFVWSRTPGTYKPWSLFSYAF